jgi:myo-inositol-1(or 4)-monophosphatase
VSEKHSVEGLSAFATEVVQVLGEKALSYYGQGARRLKFDKGLVIEAGLQLMEEFREHLYTRFPEHRVFSHSEEGEGYKHDETRYLWVYDALDGVANFQAGIPIWGMSLALLENFWPVLGVFYMPATGDLFHALAGQKAYCGDREMSVSEQEVLNDESVLLTYSRFHRHYRTNFPGKIRSLGCTAAHACYVATGRAEGAVMNNLSYEDLGAVRVIVEAAGGKILRVDGTEFFLNEYLDAPMIGEDLLVASTELGAQIRDTLKKVE